MKLLRGTRVALTVLFSHKLRTALATLGVVIGVVAGAITEVAQFAWSAAAADHVEVARWRATAPADPSRTTARPGGDDDDGGGSPR